MILDPRLVPWADVAPGVALSGALTVCGWAMFRWKCWPAMAVIALAPMAGWAWIIYCLTGGMPGIPPANAPLWVFYFAIAGAVAGMVSPWWMSCRWSRGIVAVGVAVGLIGGIRFLVVEGLHERYIAELSWGAWGALVLTGVVTVAAIAWPAKGQMRFVGQVVPFVTGLAVTSMCLTLTGTASLGLLALGLCLVTVPSAALGVFGCDQGGNHPGARPAALWMIGLPQVVAVPTLLISGSLFASTPWHVTNLALMGVTGGMAGIYAWEILQLRNRRLAAWSPLTRKIVAIIIGISITVAPVIFAIKELLDAAAAAGFPY